MEVAFFKGFPNKGCPYPYNEGQWDTFLTKPPTHDAQLNESEWFS